MNSHEDYAQSVLGALHDNLDRWGEVELARPDGPTLETIRPRLEPMLLGDPNFLAASGYHYVLMAHPYDEPEYALHVADGSQVLSEFVPQWGAPEWALPFDRPSRDDGRLLQHDLQVGPDLEVHGSNLDRLELPELANGHMPILRTQYRDSGDSNWSRESFAVRNEDGVLRSFIQLTVDKPSRAKIKSRDFDGKLHSVLDLDVRRVVHVVLDHRVGTEPARITTQRAYASARKAIINYWSKVLDGGTRIQTPERVVSDATNALLIQNLILAEKYSIGNPYETVFMMEAHQALSSLLRFGHTNRGTSSLQRLVRDSNGPAPEWYESWERGAKLRTAVEQYHLTGRSSFIRANAEVFQSYLDDFLHQIEEDKHGLLSRERYAWDIPKPVYGLHSQSVAWRGMRDIIEVLDEIGELDDANRYRASADSLRTAIRGAIAASEKFLDDGSYFVPVALFSGEHAHDSLTESRMANYWNLVAPFAFAAGIIDANSAEASGIIAYMRQHGAWLLGLTRFNGLYDPPTPIGEYREDGTGGYKAPGIDNAFGVQTMHFLADNNEADRLVLGLYAKLAHGMSPGTFVDGEATTVQPVPGERYRSTWYPPNGTSNSMFLDTLRLMLARETWTDRGLPGGLHLLPAVPRSWLAPGESISVQKLPTAFGALSLKTTAGESQVCIELELEPRRRPDFVRLHLRFPSDRVIVTTTVDGQLVEHPREHLDVAPETRTVIFKLRNSTG